MCGFIFTLILFAQNNVSHFKRKCQINASNGEIDLCGVYYFI
jgi:hypothetical protein